MKRADGKVKRGEQCSHCGRWHSRYVAVDAVAVRDGKVALIKRGNEPNRGMWALPGGFLEFDESAEETILRELGEETGLKGELGQFVGVYSDPKRDYMQNVTVVYEVKVGKGEIKAGDDALEAKWFALDEVPKLAADHNIIIEDYIKLKGEFNENER